MQCAAFDSLSLFFPPSLRFTQPFSNRPNYYTDDSSPFGWNYANSCDSGNLQSFLAVYDVRQNTIWSRREQMYDALLDKVRQAGDCRIKERESS